MIDNLCEKVTSEPSRSECHVAAQIHVLRRSTIYKVQTAVRRVSRRKRLRQGARQNLYPAREIWIEVVVLPWVVGPWLKKLKICW